MLFSVFDLETTGLSNHPDADLSRQPHVIEFGGIITDGKRILDKLEFMCYPGFEIEAAITQITGIVPADLEGKPRFNTYIPELTEFFKGTIGRVAHNLAFDRGVLEFELHRLKGSLVDIAYYPGIDICSVEQLFHRYGKRMKLSALAEIYVPDFESQAHRGLDDTLLLHEVCKRSGIYDVFSEQRLTP